MKKLTAIATALTLCLALAGCGGNNGGTAGANDQSAYEVYTAAAEAMESITALEAKTVMDIHMEAEGEALDMAMTGVIKEIMHSDTDIELSMVMTTEAMGQEMDVTAYYKDGKYYMETMGQAFVMELPIETAMEQANVESFQFDETAVKDQKVTKEADGTVLSFTLDGAALNDLISEQLGDMMSQLGSDTSYDYGDVTFSALVDDEGALRTTDMAFSFEMTIAGTTVPVEAVMTMEYVAFNDDVTIEAPADTDSYMEIDASALGL